MPSMYINKLGRNQKYFCIKMYHYNSRNGQNNNFKNIISICCCANKNLNLCVKW